MINTTPEQERVAQELVNQFINNANAKEESTMTANNTTNNATINNTNIKEVIGMNINTKIEAVKENVKVFGEESTQDYVERADASVNELKDMIVGTTKYIGDVLGLTGLYNEIVDIYTEKRSLIKTAKTVDEAIKGMISILYKVDPDDKLGKVAALKQIVYGENGSETEVRQSVFMSVAKAITWICKKVARKLRKWFGVDAENNILGEVGAKISSCFMSISNVIVSIGKATGSLLLYVGSFIVAAGVKVACFVISAIKTALTKLKEWGSIALQKIKHDDLENDIDDEDLFEDDYFDQMVEDSNQ